MILISLLVKLSVESIARVFNRYDIDPHQNPEEIKEVMTINNILGISMEED